MRSRQIRVRRQSTRDGAWELAEAPASAMDEVDSLYRRVREAGAEVAVEITDTDYGSRDFTVRDPEGNLWAFGTYRPQVAGG